LILRFYSGQNFSNDDRNPFSLQSLIVREGKFLEVLLT
jgi:hypothetical protein